LLCIWGLHAISLIWLFRYQTKILCGLVLSITIRAGLCTS